MDGVRMLLYFPGAFAVETLSVSLEHFGIEKVNLNR